MPSKGIFLTRRLWWVMIIAAVVGTLLIAVPSITKGAVSESRHDGHAANLVVIGPQGHHVAPLARKPSFLIMGSGFPANQEVSLLLVLKGKIAVTSDISYIVDQPPPMTDDTGAFAVTWNSDRVVKKKVMGPDIATLWATDQDFKAYASAPIAMCDAAAETPAVWCAAPGLK